MIYFDNSATTLQKPKEVADAVYRGIASEQFANPGRGAHSTAHNALEELFKTRTALAGLFNIKNPLKVALCQNATAALNIAIKSLLIPGDHIITTKAEHNSVLRPLYQLEKTGVYLDHIGFDIHTCELFYDQIEKSIRTNTRAIIVNHCSNVTGAICKIDDIHEICKRHNLIMIVDASQSAGTLPLDISQYDNAIFCFTGHKGLYGPQGTGGIIVNGKFDFKPVFSGGSGVHSFDHSHPLDMPDVFEAGTMNVPSFMGLAAGCNYVIKTGVENINSKLKKLRKKFVDGVKNIDGIKLYGVETSKNQVEFGAAIGINIGAMPSGEVSRLLDEKYGIATRPGAHCAPLLHETFGTEAQGIVRFSFSSFNTEEEIDVAVNALNEISKK